MPDIEWLLNAATGRKSLWVEERTPVEDENWRGSVERIEIAQGLRVFLVAADILRDMAVEPRNGASTDWLTGQISVSGVLDHRFTDGTELRIAPEQAMLFRPLESSSVVTMRGGQSLRLTGYAFDLDRAVGLFDGAVPGPLAPLFAPDPVHTPVLPTRASPHLRRLAEDLFAPGLNGPLRILFMEGVALQLLALQAAAVVELREGRPDTVSAHERALIGEARDRLLADMRSPPSLGELAAAVGMTERRLNAGFRELFGTTAFELLRNERLEHARRAITTEEVVLKEIAYRVGYNHVSNFIHAFTARFGVPPRGYPDAVAPPRRKSVVSKP
ncbi:helix-turn-helix transcriptional regulator [Azospirillum agricola]|uniref:helix-turn-helix transcriptional regulator n=1 Tax=Azospirillum agricola TaxID=1720247 RepID=UPI000A0F08F2|nr:AraC family transcriptional regulator [Azospirillum agricola]SMH28645.1 transcriptional regulator, AraC family [Azospirillum lipoferum]